MPAPEGGLIRKRALFPSLITVAAAVVLAVLFLDWAIEFAVEKVGTRINGAKVELSGVRIGWTSASITFSGLQVADKSAPMTNLVEVESMRFAIAVKPLLWKKFIIEDGTIKGIRTGTARRHSGAIWKPAEDRAEEAAAAKAGAPKPGYKLPAEGPAPKFDANKIQLEDLASYKAVQAEKDRIAKLSSEWDKTADSIDVARKVAEANALLERVKKEDYSSAAGAKKALADLKEAERLRKEIKELQDRLNASKNSVSGEISAARSSISRIDELKKQDLETAMAKYGLGSLSAEGITRAVIGPEWFGRLETGLYWFRKIRSMMPPKGKKAKQAPPPTRRGRDIIFKFKYAWPDFHLKKASISGTTSGKSPIDYRGTIKDVTSDPVLVGRPMVLELSGSGSSQTVQLRVVLDYTREKERETVDFRFTGLDLAGAKLGDAGGPVSIKSGRGNVAGNVATSGESVSGEVRFNAEPVSLQQEADKKQSGKLASAVRATLAGLKKMQVTITISGRLSSPSFGVKSGMDSAFKNAVGSMMKKDADAARGQGQKRINGLVDGEKGKLSSQVEGGASKALAKFGSKSSSLGSVQKQIDQVIADLKKKGTGSLLQKAPGGMKLPGM